MGLSTKLAQLYRIEKLRYSKKGPINIIIAISLLLAILFGASALARAVWPAHIQHKQLFMVAVSFCIHVACQVIYFIVYVPGYANLSPFYQKYRINKGVTRPWEDEQKWPKAKLRLLYYLGLNYLLVYPLMIVISTFVSGIKVRFDSPPSTAEIAWQLLFIAFCEDVFFYWAHRLAHESAFMYRFHKVHHEYTEIFSLATEYMHPVDYITGVLIPSAMPFIILGSRVHCFTFFFWQAWKMMVSTEGHCGYNFPWSPTRIFLFVSDPSFHDYHHSKNVGNYCGSIYLWDHFNGSAQKYFEQYGVKYDNQQQLEAAKGEKSRAN